MDLAQGSLLHASQCCWALGNYAMSSWGVSQSFSNACLTVVAWVTKLFGQLSQFDLNQDAILPVPGLVAICQIFSSHASIISLYMLLNLIIVALSLYSMRWCSHPHNRSRIPFVISNRAGWACNWGAIGAMLWGLHKHMPKMIIVFGYSVFG